MIAQQSNGTFTKPVTEHKFSAVEYQAEQVALAYQAGNASANVAPLKPLDEMAIGNIEIKVKRRVSQAVEDVSIIYSLTEEEIEEVTDEDKKGNILHVDYLKEIYEVNLKRY